MFKFICHMTHIDNLKNIIDSKGLLCKSQNTISYKDIANTDVQDKRAKRIVTLGPGGTLHDYVPFYFWGLSPMLYVNRNSQQNIIFLVCDIDTIEKASLPYVFTDRHALLEYAKFYDNLTGLNELDFETIKAQYWSDPNDPAKKEKKQAEFLIYHKVPWELIKGIAVESEEIANNVKYILSYTKHKPSIKVVKQWYYSL